MKKSKTSRLMIITLIITSILSLTVFSANAAESNSMITIKFWDLNKDGPSYTVKVYPGQLLLIPDLTRVKLSDGSSANDRITSISIDNPANKTVATACFEHINFEGESLSGATKDSSKSNSFKDSVWNNRISSLKIMVKY